MIDTNLFILLILRSLTLKFNFIAFNTVPVQYGGMNSFKLSQAPGFSMLNLSIQISLSESQQIELLLLISG